MPGTTKYKDPFHRFLQRQTGVYPMAQRQLEEGRCAILWMHCIFPQHRGLAKNRKGFVYGIVSPDQARDYLRHSVLGPRLIQCCEILLTHRKKTAEEIFGEAGARRLRACATLFSAVSEDGSVFHQILDRFFRGEMDPWTVGFCKGRILDMTYRKFLVAVG